MTTDWDYPYLTFPCGCRFQIFVHRDELEIEKGDAYDPD